MTGTVIRGNTLVASSVSSGSVRWQVNTPSASGTVQVQPSPVGRPFGVMPSGRSSRTVKAPTAWSVPALPTSRYQSNGAPAAGSGSAGSGGTECDFSMTRSAESIRVWASSESA